MLLLLLLLPPLSHGCCWHPFGFWIPPPRPLFRLHSKMFHLHCSNNKQQFKGICRSSRRKKFLLLHTFVVSKFHQCFTYECRNSLKDVCLSERIYNKHPYVHPSAVIRNRPFVFYIVMRVAELCGPIVRVSSIHASIHLLCTHPIVFVQAFLISSSGSRHVCCLFYAAQWVQQRYFFIGVLSTKQNPYVLQLD